MAYTFEKSIYSYELCHNGALKPSYLMRYMQAAACLDLDAKGMTYEYLREHGIVFVLTKLKIEMDEAVCKNDTIKVESWPKCIKGVTFIRDFVILKNGKRVGYATTQWALMDFVNRRPVRPTSLPQTLPDEDHEYSREVELERHIAPPETAVACGTYTRRVMLSDLDENLHLNNTNYADIMLDYIPDFSENKSFNAVQINFRGEARLGDELEISVFADGDNVYYQAENITKGHTCFEGRFILK